VVGVRNALERKSGRDTIPVWSAVLGVVLGVIALFGTAVFGASLSHLVATPRLYGDPFQLNFSDPNSQGQPSPVLLASLERHSEVTAITEGFAIEVSIHHMTVGGIAGTALRGNLLLSAVQGSLPARPDEIALGATTMRQLGAHLGSVVRVSVATPSGRQHAVPFRVVSQVSFPVLSGFVSLGNGVAMTQAAYVSAACPPGVPQGPCHQAVLSSANGGVLVSVASGPKGQALVHQYLSAYRSSTTPITAPTSLINFGQAVNFPLIFGAMLAIFGAATLLHLLVVSVARRRREMGILKVIGFVNGQVVAAVAWQATTLALIGMVIGVPLGIVAGRQVWNAFATNLGAVPLSVIPFGLLALLVVGVLVAANLLAVAPALVARRSTPAEVLRAL
jgi:ABC-type lipoprotein release transport system permease subunit